MAIRIEYEQHDEYGEPVGRARSVRSDERRPNALRLQAGRQVKRGRGVFRYDRAAIGRAAGVGRWAVYSAERRGELDVEDLASVARFIARRLAWVERRRAK